ncbi:hypothetical protein V5P93_002913 [Actinokineospora auranticolor]|uniref:Uncharacterized protein n=1 Tax=Actinokineospora auranticolor TaxID=155976 RepID=A0A2S6H0P1_9PSEU|nr:hypothetical protein [Actinokineospora auranticolor]PPK71055.1 hypothetical protein CLV40_101241 [Actinokineospora auranticolor]
MRAGRARGRRDAIWRAAVAHLDRLDTVVARGDLSSRMSLADVEVSRLSASWRALLALHRPDHRGRCPLCGRGLRGGACTVWVVAQQYFLLTSELERPTAKGGQEPTPGQGEPIGKGACGTPEHTRARRRHTPSPAPKRWSRPPSPTSNDR